MWRFRPLLYPVLLLLIGGWMVYDNFLAPNPRWRFPKAEAAAILFTSLGAIVLPFALYRVARPLPVVVGSLVAFADEEKLIVRGSIVSVDGGTCVVRTAKGDYTVDRTDLVLAKSA